MDRQSLHLAASRYNRAMLRLNLASGCLLALFSWAQISPCMMAPPDAASLQNTAEKAMAGRPGAVVVLNVRSGQILAAYHLEVAARRVTHPGSAIKPFTLLALLESGKVNDQTVLMCRRSVSIGGHKLDCSHPDTKQPLDPAAALAYSCNSYFSTIALRLTPRQLQDALVQHGFGSVTGLVQSEAAGRVVLAQSPAQLQLQAMGEWGIEVTPLQMVRAYREIATMQPTHDAKLAPLFAGLEQSVAYGMGNAAQPASAMRAAGKTGTATAEEGRWTHAWFAGYAPAERPEIVLVVFLEKGHGGGDAANVAREIFAAHAAVQKAPGFRASGAAR